jgi:proteasome assembly chaperone 3
MSMPEKPPGYETPSVEYTPFPTASKQAAGLINGAATNVSSIYFADKIMITISQGGRLSQWVRFNYSQYFVPCYE